MKRKVNNFLKATIFCLLIGMIFVKISYLFVDVSTCRLRIIGIKEEKPLDMIYVGGSETYLYWQPLRAWNEEGIVSYNYATSGVRPNAIKYYLEDILKVQEPKLFVIGLRSFERWDVPNNGRWVPPANDGGERRSIDSMDVSINRFKLAKELVQYRLNSEDIMSYFLRVMKYHANWSTVLGNSENWSLINNTGIHPNKGFDCLVLHEALEKPTAFETDEFLELSEDTLNELDELLEYCSEQELQVLFVVCPYGITKEHQTIYNTMQSMIEEKGFDFLNANLYIDEMGLDYSTDFMDVNHVNCFGAEKYTRFLAEYIKQKYELPDRRGTEDYKDWDAAWLNFCEEESEVKKEIETLWKESNADI